MFRNHLWIVSTSLQAPDRIADSSSYRASLLTYPRNVFPVLLAMLSIMAVQVAAMPASIYQVNQQAVVPNRKSLAYQQIPQLKKYIGTAMYDLLIQNFNMVDQTHHNQPIDHALKRAREAFTQGVISEFFQNIHALIS